MARHLREQSGGNPADHGPARELANEPASPRSGADFPDTPEGNRPRRGGGDLTDDQLDDFAARLGLEDADRAEETGAEPRQPPTGEPHPGEGGWADRVRRPASRLLVVAGDITTSVGTRVRTFGERLDPR